MKKDNLFRMVFTAVCIALAYVLPFMLGNVRVLGQAISPMHIPALLCGLACGWPYGVIAGAVSPILRAVTAGMPPLMPTGISMAFELAAYGFFAGLIYKALRGWNFWVRVYVSMIAAMVLGRIIGGAANALLLGISGGEVSLSALITAYFVGTAAGMVIHLIVVPVIMYALHKAKLLPGDR